MSQVEGKIQKDHLRQFYRLIHHVQKLKEKHEAEKRQQQENFKVQLKKLQATIEQKDQKIKQLQDKLSQKTANNNLQLQKILKTVLKSSQNNKLQQKIKQITIKDQQINTLKEQIQSLKDDIENFSIQILEQKKRYQDISQQLKITYALQRVFIPQNDLILEKNFNTNSMASFNGFNDNNYWNVVHRTSLTPQGWYLNIPQKILNDKNIKAVHKLIKQNQWYQLEHLCFNPKAQLQPQQKNYVNDQLWKIFIQPNNYQGNRKFENLKILNLCNHRILTIQKKDLQRFPNLQLLDFRTNSIQIKDIEIYKKSIEALKQYVEEHPKIEILVTTINGQTHSWRKGEYKTSKDIPD